MPTVVGVDTNRQFSKGAGSWEQGEGTTSISARMPRECFTK